MDRHQRGGNNSVTNSSFMEEKFPLLVKVSLYQMGEPMQVEARLIPIDGITIMPAEGARCFTARPGLENEFDFDLQYRKKLSNTIKDIEIRFFESKNNRFLGYWRGDVTVGRSDPQKHGIKNNENQTIGTIQLFIFYTKIRERIRELKSRYGLEFELYLAIDFTYSNDKSDDTKVRGLHDTFKVDSCEITEYSRCLEPVCKLLSDAGGVKKLNCWGFGGFLRGYPYASQDTLFNLSGNPALETADTYEKVLEWYNGIKEVVKKQSSTNFAPIIDKLLRAHQEKIKKPGEKNLYSILVIMTDGQVGDYELKETTESIFKCLNYRVSIIIMGIGQGEFTNMRHLDGDSTDEKPERCSLQSNGKYANRDIVQFVECESLKDDHESIIKYALEELPKHIEEALGNNNIK